MKNRKNKFKRFKIPGKMPVQLPVITIIIIGSLISLACFFIIRRRETNDIIEEFQREVENQTAALQRTLNEKIRIFESIQHFFMASLNVEREEFSEYVKPFLNAPSIKAYAWAPRVKHQNRKKFESDAKLQGLEDFEIYETDENEKPIPAADNVEYFPVFYAEPISQNYKFLGLDFSSIPARVEVMNTARDSGKPAATERIPVPSSKSRYGILVFLPVYHKDIPHESIEEKRKDLEGFVVGFIKIGELVEKALELVTLRGLDIRITDLNAPESKSFLYNYHPQKDENSVPRLNKRLHDLPEELQSISKVYAANRQWSVICTPTTALISLFRTPLPWTMLIIGYILTALLVTYVILNSRRTAAIEKLVEVRTGELNVELSERKEAEKALRKSEQRFRSLVDNIPGAVYRTDINPPWKAYLFSEAVTEITGYEPEDFYEGKINFGDLVIPSDFKMLEQTIDYAIKHKDSYSIEYGIYHQADRSIRYVQESGKAVYDDNDKPLFLDGVIVDITNRRLNEKERERLIKIVEAKNKELQSIVYIASHDLKSPLVNIMGFGEELALCCRELKNLLVKETRDENDCKAINNLLDRTIPESLGFINAGSNKINMLINGLLQVSRAGSVTLNIEPLDMNRILKDITESIVFKAREIGVDITVDRLPSCIGDAPAVNQIFSNLINNAMKYLDPHRKGKVHIWARAEINSCIYCVQDNGIGIAEEYKSKVFELFYRLNPEDSAGGEGLGLTIVTRILDRLNGSISLESEEGKGSRFYITLPKA